MCSEDESRMRGDGDAWRDEPVRYVANVPPLFVPLRRWLVRIPASHVRMLYPTYI